MTADHAAEVENGRGACLAARRLHVHAQPFAGGSAFVAWANADAVTVGSHDG